MFSVGEKELLKNINLQINAGEKICLIGRNGEGKTTLLKIIAGLTDPDSGDVIKQQNILVEELAQEVPGAIHGSVFDVVKSAFSSHHVDDFRIYTILSKLSLDPELEFSKLSGGLKRRVLFARALVQEPDLLLLDEPTNHLDLEAIIWLEKLLLTFKGTLLFVTHDRTFLQKIATRIIEIDRTKLTSWECDYQNYLERKEALLIAEEEANRNFDKQLSKEEYWVRHGITARRKRNMGRVRKLHNLRQERQARKTLSGKASLKIQTLEKSGKLVIEAKNISFGYSDKSMIKDFSTNIMRGDKIGIIGANGSGKTTLLRLLLGELKPDSGSIRYGTKLEIAYFDQLRSQLNEEQTLRDNVGGGSDIVTINGESKHIMSYLQDFLFTPQKSMSLVKNLSGGERNRLLLAKLFTKPANVLVMDEPTNDLDIEMLELLENILVDYPGTLLLVSHDRTFLNNVVTSTIAFEANGDINEYVGGYDDYLRQKPKSIAVIKPQAEKTPKEKVTIKKPSYREKRELDQLPKKIETLEIEQKNLFAEMLKTNFYQQEKERIIAVQTRLKTIETELENSYQRWAELEEQ